MVVLSSRKKRLYPHPLGKRANCSKSAAAYLYFDSILCQIFVKLPTNNQTTFPEIL